MPLHLSLLPSVPPLVLQQKAPLLPSAPQSVQKSVLLSALQWLLLGSALQLFLPGPVQKSFPQLALR